MRSVGTGLAGALLACATVAAAQSSLPPLPPVPARYFNDYASLVDEGTERRMEDKLRQFDQATSTQVLVVVFPELPWPSLEDFTIRAAEAWKVGRKGLDNGAILFVFVEDRAVRIEVGYGLEGALPDALANRIIQETIVPAFQQGRFAEGVEAGADAIMAATRGEYTAPAGARRRTGGGSILTIVVILLLLNFLIGRRMSRGRYTTYGRRGRRSGWAGPIFWGGGWGGGGGFGRGGGFGGGGFSGGGGSFGGGGASGRW